MFRSPSTVIVARRAFATLPSRLPPKDAPMINLVEVGPRDGLQNEKSVVPVSVKVELVNRLASAGLRTIEAALGYPLQVSPKWVPQMVGTPQVLRSINHPAGVRYPVLVPNKRGLRDLLSFLGKAGPETTTTTSSAPPPPPSDATDEIAIFTAATDAFTRANLNKTVSESLIQLEEVAKAALDHGLRVRGYVSVVIECPYSGRVDRKMVRQVAKQLWEMGCYEVSLGDTMGKGTPVSVAEMIEEVKKSVPVDKLAGHFHDTYGTALANVFTALDHGIYTIDSSIAGLGGCPYSPGATGNVATEDVVYALQHSGYRVAGLNMDSLEKLVDVGFWISKELGRENNSRAGKALRAAAALGIEK